MTMDDFFFILSGLWFLWLTLGILGCVLVFLVSDRSGTVTPE